jgi:hypothetical protein
MQSNADCNSLSIRIYPVLQQFDANKEVFWITLNVQKSCILPLRLFFVVFPTVFDFKAHYTLL